MRELIEFRRDPEHRLVSDDISDAIVEKQFIRNIEALLEAPEMPEKQEYVPVDDMF